MQSLMNTMDRGYESPLSPTSRKPSGIQRLLSLSEAVDQCHVEDSPMDSNEAMDRNSSEQYIQRGHTMKEMYTKNQTMTQESYATKLAARMRTKRSTKSKCPPGLRSGKWTTEEETYASMLIYYFKHGLLDIEEGTSLRWYLAKQLNCEAMRVTKKLKGDMSIGKQVFRAAENTDENQKRIAQAHENLKELEKLFIESQQHNGYAGTVQSSKRQQTPSISPANQEKFKFKHHEKIFTNSMSEFVPPARQLRRTQSQNFDRKIETRGEDVNLLVHFITQANTSEKSNAGKTSTRLERAKSEERDSTCNKRKRERIW